MKDSFLGILSSPMLRDGVIDYHKKEKRLIAYAKSRAFYVRSARSRLNTTLDGFSLDGEIIGSSRMWDTDCKYGYIAAEK